jgi:hypothetical protein
MERNLTASPRTIGSNEATVMERLDAPGAAPTTVERKVDYNNPQGEATVLERQVAMPPAKSRMPLIAAAAAIIIVLAIVAGVVMRKPAEPAVAATPAVPAGTNVTATASGAPLAPGEGVLLLSASPWADIERIVSKGDQKEMNVTDDSTPARIKLPEGAYSVTLSGENGTQTIDVQIEAGKPTQKNVRMRDLNFEELTREIQRP